MAGFRPTLGFETARWPGHVKMVGLAIFILSVSAGLVTKWQLVSSKALDDDELQHVHFAWCLTQGLIPYRDFWDNHPPTLHYLLAQVIHRIGPGPQIFLTGRRLMFGLGIITFIATFLLGRRAFDTATALAAVVWLSCCQAFIVKTVEIRPDVVLVGMIVVAVWLATVAITTRRVGRRVLLGALAGGALGLGFTFSTKAIIPLGVMLSAWPVTAWLQRQNESRIKTGAMFLAQILGFLAIACVWLGLQARQGTLPTALRFTLFDNLIYPDRFRPWESVHTESMYGILLAGAVGLFFVINNFRHHPSTVKGRETGIVKVYVALCALGIGGIYFFVMPAPYMQSSLMFLPLWAVLAGFATRLILLSAINQSKQWPSRLIATLVLAGFGWLAVVYPVQRLQQRAYNEAKFLENELKLIGFVEKITSPEDVVFDGRSLATFRKHALYRPVLVKGLLDGYRTGRITPSVRQELRTSGCTLYFKDSRTSRLPEDDLRFLDSHFVLVDPMIQMYLPGQAYSGPQLQGKGAVFDVITSGTYRLTRRDNSESITLINGTRVDETIQLGIGRFHIRSEGPQSDLTIVRVSFQPRF